MRDVLIERFKLLPHPECGYYWETFRSEDKVGRDARGELLSASTAIYYMLCDGAYSAWHRIRSDELWALLRRRSDPHSRNRCKWRVAHASTGKCAK